VLVSHTHRFIHLKTFKAASTSVEAHFQPWCMPSVDDEIEHATAEVIGPTGIVGARGSFSRDPSVRFVHHMPAEAVRAAIGRRRFRRYLKFAVVRDPYDRAVSGFWHTLSAEERDVLARAPMSEVRAAFSDHLARGDQARWSSEPILAIRARSVLDRALRYERLASDVAALERELELPVGREIPRYKTDRRLRDEPAAAYYDERSRAVVASVHRWEFATFGYPV
jgi:hypothetical protein